jgi:transcription termination factor NusB
MAMAEMTKLRTPPNIAINEVTYGAAFYMISTSLLTYMHPYMHAMDIHIHKTTLLQAVELAKRYSYGRAYRVINGCLANFIQSEYFLEIVEV